ncbi:vezatin [Amia ocellicauda]|uniref:vezatin n=1 Tax=Amia ocellicauda TaxID=2972642 RepID=UPI003464583A
MTEEFDEEVVFENSPLFQYLQDLGHTDFETCPTVSQEEEQCAGEEGPLLQDIPTTPRKGLFLKLADALLRWSPFSQSTKSDSPEQQLDVGFRQYSLHTILGQEVLLQEDVELIELLDPSILSTGSSEHAHSGPAPDLRSLAVPTVWDLSVLAAFAGVFVGVRFLAEGLPWMALGPWLLAFSAFLLLRGLSLWRTARLQRTMRLCSRQLEELAANSRAVTSLVRRALRLVQETEVISRGFTLVSAAYPFNKAGPHRSQQLLGLRRAVYRSLRATFRACRLATCHMLNTYPLNSEIDNATNYVSTVPLKELGLGLSEEQLSDERAQELTDDYSLPALKVLFQLWVGQSSEFFRRLALLLSPGQDQQDWGLMHQAVSEVTGPLHCTLTSCLGDLRRSYDFHRYFETQQQPPAGPERSRKVRQEHRELGSLYTAVRSLQLHLKALLNEVIILEDELEKLMVSDGPAEMTCAGCQDLQDKLRLIQPHMQASSSCWEDAVTHVDRMLRRATNCTGKPDSPEEVQPPLIPPLPTPITHIEDRDPVPEEQELEAYVEDSDSEAEGRGSLFDLLSPEERERQKKEREESRRVLQELKSVLGLRASEVERQKWKQLLFSDQAVLKPIVPVEAAGPDDTPGAGLDTDSPVQDSSQHNHLAEELRGEEGGDSRESPSPAPAGTKTEYSCGLPAQGDVLQDQPHEGVAPSNPGATLHYQYDGTEGEGQTGAESADAMSGLAERAPPVSVKERLTGLHGTAALSFSSALAAQVAAKSHSFSSMQEQTFGDEEEEEEEEEEELSRGDEEE